jgi:hypothetical protein
VSRSLRALSVAAALAAAVLATTFAASADDAQLAEPQEAAAPRGAEERGRPLPPSPPEEPPGAHPVVAPLPIESDEDSDIDYTTARYEPAGFPLVGGNSDIGLQFGLAGRLVRFADGAKPYVFRVDLLLTASVRDSGGKLGVAQQEYICQLDLPNLGTEGRIRTTPAIQFLNFVDAGYFGRGNASSAEVPATVAGERERYFQQTARELRIRDFTRIRIKKPFDLMIAPIFRYHDHQAYPGSKLAIDAQQGVVRGLRSVVITSLALGVVIDNRDNEFFPRRGMYHQIGERFEQGYPIDGDVQMGASGAILAGYVPLGKSLVAAGRLVLDFQYGKVPYYDLYNAGPFNEWEMPGGANGIRGVPWGRYSAPIKTIANIELRAMHYRFGLFGQKFRLGNDVFFDIGRVFDAYRFDAPRDGRGVGLKWGVGGGTYLMWGESAVFRLELAFSPDAVEANPRFPIGLYLADGVMF